MPPRKPDTAGSFVALDGDGLLHLRIAHRACVALRSAGESAAPRAGVARGPGADDLGVCRARDRVDGRIK